MISGFSLVGTEGWRRLDLDRGWY